MEAYKYLPRLRVALGLLVCLKVARTNGNGTSNPHQWRLSRIQDLDVVRERILGFDAQNKALTFTAEKKKAHRHHPRRIMQYVCLRFHIVLPMYVQNPP